MSLTTTAVSIIGLDTNTNITNIENTQTPNKKYLWTHIISIILILKNSLVIFYVGYVGIGLYTNNKNRFFFNWRSVQ